MATSFTTHSAGQVILSSAINLIQTAVNALENAPSAPLGATPPPSAFGFSAWAFDSADQPAVAFTTVTTTVYTSALYLPAGTVTNLYVIPTNTGVPTNAFMALYTTAGALLGQSAQASGLFGTATLKTIPLATPQVVTAGLYYVAFWASGGTQPQLLRASATDSRHFNVVASGSLLRAASSGTAATTTAPSPLGTLTATNNLVWMAAS